MERREAMLEKIDLKKKLTKAEYDLRMEELVPKLGRLQRECQKYKIPVMIAFEGSRFFWLLIKRSRKNDLKNCWILRRRRGESVKGI